MHPRHVFSLTGKGIHWAAAWMPLFLCLILSSLILTALPVFAEDPLKKGKRPGMNDTITPARRSLFKDSEAFLIERRQWDSTVTGFQLTPDSTPPNYAADQWNWSSQNLDGVNSRIANNDWRPVAAGSGRLESHKFDSVVHAYFDDDMRVKVVVLAANGIDMLASITLDGNYPGGRSLDLDVGDLDNEASTVKDENGKDIYVFYDEIVVVNTLGSEPDGDRAVQVTALKLVHHPDGTCTLQKLGDSFTGRYAYNPEFAAVAIGDLDIRMPALSDKDKKENAVYSERQNEFAVAVAGNCVGWTQVLWFQIDTQDPNNPKLVQHTGTEIKTQCLHLDITAGDFDGDGQDELCIVHRSSDGKGHILYALLQVEDTETETPALKQTAGDYLGDGGSHYALEGEIRVVSGLFKLDPDNGYGFNRKQVMVAYASGFERPFFNDRKNFAVIGVYQPGLDGSANMGMNQLCIFWQSPQSSPKEYETALRHIDLAVGNFVGHGSDGKAQSPTEQGLLSYQLWWYMPNIYLDDPLSTHTVFAIADPGVQGQINSVPSWIVESIYNLSDPARETYNYRTAVAAPDRDGNTWVLGTPMHIAAPNYQGMDRYIQEPPKHVDYLPDDTGKNWAVQNVSYYKYFYTELASSSEGTFTTETTKDFSWDVGGSVSFELENKVTAKVTTADVRWKTKIGYDHANSEATYSGTYQTYKLASTDQTNQDDVLTYRYQVMDIWRYPIFGFDTGDPDNPKGLYELVIPGPHRTVTAAALTCSDWFQPSHASHNALSYPSTVPAAGDVGSYYVCPHTVDKASDKCGWQENTTLNDPSQYNTFDGNLQTRTVQWSDTTMTGAKRFYSNTIQESTELTIGTDCNFELERAKTRTTINFHANQSWSNNTETKATQTYSVGIDLVVPEAVELISHTQYNFNMAAYYDFSGTLRVAYGAPGLTEGLAGSWWQTHYNTQPDLSLNLCNRFDYSQIDRNVVPSVALNKDPDRMEAREIYLTKTELNPISKTYDYLGETITDDKKVRVCAKIHNFSGVDVDMPFKVAFAVMPVDPKSASEWPVVQKNQSVNKNVYEPVYIGTATVNGVKARESAEAAITWDAANPTKWWNAYYYTDSNTGKIVYAGYRFYVTVDTEDAVKNEIHELKGAYDPDKPDWADKDGFIYSGNNRGYWPWNAPVTVLHVPDGDTANEAPMDIAFHDRSLGVQIEDQILHDGQITLQKGQTYPLRVHVQIPGPTRWFRHVLFYEAHPSATDRVIGDHLMFGSNGKDAWVWSEWTPQQVGEYDLHACLLEDMDDPVLGNALDSLHVTVTDGGSPGGGGDSSGCFINSLMP